MSCSTVAFHRWYIYIYKYIYMNMILYIVYIYIYELQHNQSKEFQRFCGVMFGATRNPMLRCGAATRGKAVDSCRYGTAMLDLESPVELLRWCGGLSVDVRMVIHSCIHVCHGCWTLVSSLKRCCMSWLLYRCVRSGGESVWRVVAAR